MLRSSDTDFTSKGKSDNVGSTISDCDSGFHELGVLSVPLVRTFTHCDSKGNRISSTSNDVINVKKKSNESCPASRAQSTTSLDASSTSGNVYGQIRNYGKDINAKRESLSSLSSTESYESPPIRKGYSTNSSIAGESIDKFSRESKREHEKSQKIRGYMSYGIKTNYLVPTVRDACVTKSSHFKESTTRKRRPKPRSKSVDANRRGSSTGLFSPVYSKVLSEEEMVDRREWAAIIKKDCILEEEYYKVPYEECNREVILGRFSRSEPRLNFRRKSRKKVSFSEETKENDDKDQRREVINTKKGNAARMTDLDAVTKHSEGNGFDTSPMNKITLWPPSDAKSGNDITSFLEAEKDPNSNLHTLIQLIRDIRTSSDKMTNPPTQQADNSQINSQNAFDQDEIELDCTGGSSLNVRSSSDNHVSSNLCQPDEKPIAKSSNTPTLCNMSSSDYHPSSELNQQCKIALTESCSDISLSTRPSSDCHLPSDSCQQGKISDTESLNDPSLNTRSSSYGHALSDLCQPDKLSVNESWNTPILSNFHPASDLCQPAKISVTKSWNAPNLSTRSSSDCHLPSDPCQPGKISVTESWNDPNLRTRSNNGCLPSSDLSQPGHTLVTDSLNDPSLSTRTSNDCLLLSDLCQSGQTSVTDSWNDPNLRTRYFNDCLPPSDLCQPGQTSDIDCKNDPSLSTRSSNDCLTPSDLCEPGQTSVTDSWNDPRLSTRLSNDCLPPSDLCQPGQTSVTDCRNDPSLSTRSSNDCLPPSGLCQPGQTSVTDSWNDPSLSTRYSNDCLPPSNLCQPGQTSVTDCRNDPCLRTISSNDCLPPSGLCQPGQTSVTDSWNDPSLSTRYSNDCLPPSDSCQPGQTFTEGWNDPSLSTRSSSNKISQPDSSLLQPGKLSVAESWNSPSLSDSHPSCQPANASVIEDWNDPNLITSNDRLVKVSNANERTKDNLYNHNDDNNNVLKKTKLRNNKNKALRSLKIQPEVKLLRKDLNDEPGNSINLKQQAKLSNINLNESRSHTQARGAGVIRSKREQMNIEAAVLQALRKRNASKKRQCTQKQPKERSDEQIYQQKNTSPHIRNDSVNIFMRRNANFTDHHIELTTCVNSYSPNVSITRMQVPFSAVRDQWMWAKHFWPLPGMAGHNQSQLPAMAGHNQSQLPAMAGHDQSQLPAMAGLNQSQLPAMVGHSQSQLPTMSSHNQSQLPSMAGYNISQLPANNLNMQMKKNAEPPSSPLEGEYFSSNASQLYSKSNFSTKEEISSPTPSCWSSSGSSTSGCFSASCSPSPLPNILRVFPLPTPL